MGKAINPIEGQIKSEKLLISALQRNNKIVLLSLVVSLILGVALTYKIATTENRYFTVDAGGRIVELVALHRAMATDKAVTRFASDVAQDIYSFNHLNYKKQLVLIESYFSKAGYEKLLLEIKGNIDSVKKNLLYSSSHIVSVPTIVKKGIVDGVYHWKVEMKIRALYIGPGKKFQQDLAVSVKIRRNDNRSNPRGVEAYSFIAQNKGK